MNKCKNCTKELTRKQSKFCSSSCAATYNNKLRPKKSYGTCMQCNNELSRQARKYCSTKCQQRYQYERWVESYKLDITIVETKLNVSSPLRRYITERDGYKCSECNIESWNDKQLTLEFDHIDGNAHNNHEANCRLLCPNCHSQTDTYKAKNTGSGRKARK